MLHLIIYCLSKFLIKKHWCCSVCLINYSITPREPRIALILGNIFPWRSRVTIDLQYFDMFACRDRSTVLSQCNVRERTGVTRLALKIDLLDVGDRAGSGCYFSCSHRGYLNWFSWFNLCAVIYNYDYTTLKFEQPLKTNANIPIIDESHRIAW